MSVNYVDDGNDDGTNFGRSNGKIGFYGLTTPIVKQTLTVACTATSTIITIATGLAELQDALGALGLLKLAE